MHWTHRANILTETTTLGHRQAQIYVLTQQGHDTNTIHTKLTQHTDNPPEKSTIRHTKHALNNKLNKTHYTTEYTTSDLKLRPPLHPDIDDKTQDIQLYNGQIGSGKTVTTMTHFIATQHPTSTPTVILDTLDGWKHITEALGNAHTRYSPTTHDDIDETTFIDTSTASENTATTTVREVLNRVISDWLAKPDGAELIIDDGTRFIQTPIFLEALQEQTPNNVLTPDNKAIRIVTQTYTPDTHLTGITPSLIHYHRQESVPPTQHNLSASDWEHITNAKTGHVDDYTEVLTRTRSGETYKTKVKLTEQEQELIE